MSRVFPPNNLKAAGESLREPHMVQVNGRIHYIADRLENLAGRLEEQLKPIMVSAPPCEESNKKELTPQRPILFEELHNNLNELDRWIDTLFRISDRIEL